MVDRADHAIVAPDLAIMERLPLAIGHAREIGDDGMDMRLGVEGPARVVLEEGIDEIAGPERDLLAVDILATLGEVGLDPFHGRLDRCHIGVEHPLVACDIGHHRGGLRHGKGEVDSRLPVLDLTHHRTVGKAAIENTLEGIFGHLAGEAELVGPFPGPAAYFGAAIGCVVIVLGEVVRRT